MDSLTFLYLIFGISIGLLLVTLIIVVTFLLPLQLKEYAVKNGLAKLRKRLVFSGISLMLLCLISIVVLSARFFINGEFARYTISGLIFLYALGFIANALNWLAMYREQYTDENKQLHEKIDEIEHQKDN